MLNTLAQVQEKKGPKYVDSILNEEVVITENIDTFRLIFEKKDGEIIFYKKDNTPINLIERTLSNIYEEAICEIPIITKDANIPEGLFFGLYYTPVERPLRIPYSKLPKYILTDVSKREGNKITERYNYDVVKDWAAELCMGRPPVLFEGKLSSEQKNLLIAYDTKQYEGEEMTFSKMIEKSFNASYSQEDIIEGIVIKSKNKLLQIVSYEFELLNEAYENVEESRDLYDILITDISQFLTHYNVPLLEANSKDELYINIVSDIFNRYSHSKGAEFKLDWHYLTPPKFGYAGELNKKFITNENAIKWIEKAPIYEAVFKVILSSFRKPKKSYGLLTESIVEQFNSLVYLINGYVNKFETVEEELNESRSENIVVDAFKRRKPSDVDNMRVIASIQKAFEPKIRDIARGTKPCAIYLTTYEPFSIAQMNNVHRISDMWNCPVLLAGVSNEFKIEGENFHPSDDLMKGQMTALMNSDNSLMPSFMLLDSWNLTEIFEFCRPHFEPTVIITDTGKKSEMTIQLFFEEEVMGGRINVEEVFNIGELENEDKLMTFRAIEDNNYSLFLELTPIPIHNLFDKMFAEYRYWSGQLLKPINEDK